MLYFYLLDQKLVHTNPMLHPLTITCLIMNYAFDYGHKENQKLRLQKLHMELGSSILKCEHI